MARGVYTDRPQILVVHPGGFGSWDRYIVRAVYREVDARAASARSTGKTARVGEFVRMDRKAAKSQRCVAALSRDAIVTLANVRLLGAIEAARTLGKSTEEKRVKERTDFLADRLKRVREHPVDAASGKPVVMRASRQQKAAKARLLQTASKFKGGGRARAPRPVQEDEPVVSTQFGQVLVSPERVASIRMQVELERNRRSVPIRWDALDVDQWMIGAYESLFRLPMMVRPRSYGNAMPTPTNHAGVEWGDELARLTLDDDDDTPPLFGIARLRTLGIPDKIDVDRMHTALRWPWLYLSRDADLARFVGLGAMWKAVDLNHDMMEKRVRDRLDMWYFDFDRKRGLGLTAIAEGLNMRAVSL